MKYKSKEEERSRCGGNTLYPKVYKPVIERRRRAKVTENIQQIRMLIPTGNNMLPSSCRLERAEILEQAVNHIKEGPTRMEGAGTDDHSELAAGYASCLAEVLSCLDEENDAEIRAKLCSHIADIFERRTVSPPGATNSRHHQGNQTPTSFTMTSPLNPGNVSVDDSERLRIQSERLPRFPSPPIRTSYTGNDVNISNMVSLHYGPGLTEGHLASYPLASPQNGASCDGPRVLQNMTDFHNYRPSLELTHMNPHGRFVLCGDGRSQMTSYPGVFTQGGVNDFSDLGAHAKLYHHR